MGKLSKLLILILCCAVCLNPGGARADSESAAPGGGETASFLWITDLQDCSYHPGEYAAVAEWCVRLAEENGVSFLMGTGDYVGKWNSARQWEEFRTFLRVMNGKVPGLYIAGNHDYCLRTEDFSAFLSPVYGNRDCSGEEFYENGRGRYAVVNAGGIDWLIVGMSYSCGASEREWIGGVLERHPGLPAILLFHNYLESTGKFTAPGERVYEDVVAAHPNVRLILCGHNHGTRVRTDWPEGPEGRFVQTVMYNFQERQVRRGSVQLLRIDIPAQTVHLLCQSPIKTKIRPLTEEFRLDLRDLPGQ